MRESEKTSAGSRSTPLSVTFSTESAMRSMNESAPGSEQVNATVVTVWKFSGPVVRSRRTS